MLILIHYHFAYNKDKDSVIQKLYEMEKPKLNISQSIRFLSKNKHTSIASFTKVSKTHDFSINKQNNKKPSAKNITKTHYFVKKGSKKENISAIHKTSICTPAETTAFISCISTPNSRSLDKKQFIKKLYYQDIQPVRQKRGQLLYASDNFSSLEETYKIKFIVSERKCVVKYFSLSSNTEKVKKIITEELKKKWEKGKSYYGLISLYTVEANVKVDKLLKNDRIELKFFKEAGIPELNLRVLVAKKKPSYLNLQLNSFDLIKFLGSGGFSSVYLARCNIDGLLCGLKFIKKSSIVNENKYKMLENQRNILFKINHQRLVDLHYAFESKNYIVFGLEFCPNGNLYQLLQKRKNLSEPEAKFLFSQILEGLGELHSQKILFRDMKLENILFDPDGNVKITDFGLSKPYLQDSQITYSYCGSPEYMAPQMLAKSGHNFQIDHYALGILLFELLYGRSPFFAPKKQQIFHAILNSEPHFPKFPIFSKEVKQLIRGLLQKNPRHRIGSLKGIQEIMSHPWIRGYSTINMESPFKVPLSQQNHYCQEQINIQFAEDLVQVWEQKVFFEKGFVNKQLISKLEEAATLGDKQKGLKSEKLMGLKERSKNKYPK